MQNTRACDEVDAYCQTAILQRNPSQTKAWHQVEDANITKNGFVTSKGSLIRWWESLSGTVTLPTESLTAIVGQASTLAEGEQLCAQIETAVDAGEIALRKARPILKSGSGATGVISTACRSAIKYQVKPGARAQSLARLLIDDATLKQLVNEWRATMHWSDTRETGDGVMVGVWDGDVKLEPSFARDETRFPPLNWITGANKRENTLPGGSAVAWIDPFPLSQFPQPPHGPCGEPVDYPQSAHATLIAGMLAGTKEGFAPGIRLWNHVWDARRILYDNDTSPRASIGWFLRNVVEGEALLQRYNVPFLANLSCGSTSSDPDAGPHLSLVMAGRPLNGQTIDLIPYAVSVAAGNLGVSEVDQPLPHPIGYPWLARQSTTAGFVSVVGLSPDADDVLRCKHIQELIARLSQGKTDLNGTFITDSCPTLRTGGPSEEKSFVKYGSAFDVGAIGLGVGPTEVPNTWAVMWGSSFAAPYVGALMADIVSKAKRMGARPYPAVAANLVADRIRFTSDPLDDLVKYGVINAKRALAFETDQIDLQPPPDPNNLSPDQRDVQQCVDAAGYMELDRQTPDVTLPVLNATDKISLSEVLRLRLDGPAFQAILRPKPPVQSKMLVTVQVDGRDIELPLVCRKPASASAQVVPAKTKLLMKHLGSFTRCSFLRSCT
jgi:hypothetical protein